MKKNLFLMAIISLLAALSISAQEKATDFSGNWELDVSKSKLEERDRARLMIIESMMMNVAQTEKDIKIETTVERAEFGGRKRVPFMVAGNGALVYTLDGKESKITRDSEMGAIPVTLKAKIEDGKMQLTSVRTMNTQMGEMTITVKEIWSLSDEGKTLTVMREMQTPRGNNSSEMVFAKKDSTVISTNPATNTSTATTRKISAGVLNGKAVNLVVPQYPAEARSAKASGAVNVQVTIDEQGNVISAKAVSGDTLLRAASEEAARQSKFSPTLLQGVPVIVTGVIIYNFVP